MDAKALAGVDVVINLAGAGIADKRWTAQRKKELLDSRLDSLSTLSEQLSVLEKKPALFIGASAVGYYGDRGEERLSCLLYTSPSPRDRQKSRMPSSA